MWRDILKKTCRFSPLFSPLFFFLSVLLRYNWHTLLYLYTEQHYWHVRSPDVWGFFPHIKAIHDINWVSYNLTQFWPTLPGDNVRSTGYGLSPRRLSSLQMSIPSPGCHPYLCPIGSRLELWPPFWGSVVEVAYRTQENSLFTFTNSL